MGLNIKNAPFQGFYSDQLNTSTIEHLNPSTLAGLKA